MRLHAFLKKIFVQTLENNVFCLLTRSLFIKKIYLDVFTHQNRQYQSFKRSLGEKRVLTVRKAIFQNVFRTVNVTKIMLAFLDRFHPSKRSVLRVFCSTYIFHYFLIEFSRFNH